MEQLERLHDSAAFSTHVGSCINTETVITLLGIITSLPGNPAGDRKGGFIVIYDKEADSSMVAKSFGEFPEDRTGQYLSKACQKVMLLLSNGKLRSFGEYKGSGGAIKLGTLIIGTAGLPEKLDEALSFVYHTHVTYTSGEGVCPFGDHVRSLAKEVFYGNEFIIPVLDAFAEKRHR